jgi:hypothetical protein
LWDPTDWGPNKPLRRVLEALASLSDDQLLALWRHVEGLPDEEIAKQWKSRRLRSDNPSAEAVAEARESAIARLRRQPDLAHMGVYYQPMDPEQSVLVQENAEHESALEAQAVQRGLAAVHDTLTAAFRELPDAVEHRVRKFLAHYDELARYEREQKERMLSSSSRRPGSRRWQHLLRQRRKSLEEQLFASLYPGSKNRRVARNMLRRDLQTVLSRIAEIADLAAKTAEPANRRYFQCLALRATECLSGGSVKGYLERVRWLRALVRAGEVTG